MEEYRCVYRCKRCGQEFETKRPMDNDDVNELLGELALNCGDTRKYSVHHCEGNRMGVGVLVGFTDCSIPEELEELIDGKEM